MNRDERLKVAESTGQSCTPLLAHDALALIEAQRDQLAKAEEVIRETGKDLRVAGHSGRGHHCPYRVALEAVDQRATAYLNPEEEK